MHMIGWLHGHRNGGHEPENEMNPPVRQDAESLNTYFVAKLVDMLPFALELTGSKDGAIAYARKHSCAGPAPWRKALAQLGWDAK